MKKRLLVLIAALALFGTMLAGCGDTSDEQTTDGGSTNQTEHTEGGANSGDEPQVESKGTITVAASATPHSEILEQAKPINKMFKGWRTDISGCRKKEELPREALEYIAFIEEAVGVKIKYVSVGAERDQYIVL